METIDFSIHHDDSPGKDDVLDDYDYIDDIEKNNKD